MTGTDPLLPSAEIVEMESGDSCFWPAVAQDKPALRKRLLTELGDRASGFSVRYGNGGVTLTRLRKEGE